ncbi:MAG: response regulator transcription factor [Oligoflexales bacterium]
MVAGNKKLNLPKSILFVDDEEDLGYLMNHWFSQNDHVKVDCTHNGEEAWKTAQGFHYDFIVLDWKIDGKLDGLALVNRFRQHRFYCDIPVLVISGFLSKKEFSIVEEFPLTGIYEKPLQEQAFLQAISNLYQDCVWYKKQQVTITKSIRVV